MKYRGITFFFSLLSVLLLIGLGFLMRSFSEQETFDVILTTAIITVAGIGCFFSLWIKQDKPFFLLIFTLFAFLLIDRFSIYQHADPYYSHIAYPLMCILFPVNLYLIAHLNEKEAFIRSFMRKVVLVGGQILAIYLFTYRIPSLFGPDAFSAFKKNLGDFLSASFFHINHFPSALVLLSFIICLCACLAFLYRKNDWSKMTFLAVFILTFIAFCFVPDENVAPIFLLASEICVLLSLLSTSHRMAFLDELTDIPGRRALANALLKYEKSTYVVAIADIDFFKRLNDSYGHEVGDQGLRLISARLVQQIPKGHIFRYGGEEFVLFFPNKRLEEVLDDIEDTRERISTSDFFLDSLTRTDRRGDKNPYLASIRITLSVGVTEREPGTPFDVALNNADKALYKAKQTGRNKTVYFKADRFFELY